MTNKELIEILKTQPEDNEVRLRHVVSGVCKVFTPKKTNVDLDVKDGVTIIDVRSYK